MLHRIRFGQQMAFGGWLIVKMFWSYEKNVKDGKQKGEGSKLKFGKYIILLKMILILLFFKTFKKVICYLFVYDDTKK